MKTITLFCLLICTGFVSCSDSTERQQQLNVVLVSIDSVRRDHLGIYGHRPRYAPEVAISPNIDSLAKEGVVFDDAFTTTSWTLPAHMSLMTGRSDLSHGVLTDRFHLDPQHRTLAQEFSAAGYSTAGYYSGPYLSDKYGFDAGFDSYESGMISSIDFREMVIDDNAKRKAQGREPMDKQMIAQLRDRMSHWDITSPKINELAEGFIDQSNDDPFFLFVHYFDAHYDHIPQSINPQLAQLFDPSYSGDFDGSNWYFDSRVMDLSPPYARHISERDLNHVIANYDAEINWVDHHIGKLIEKLKAKGVWDNTIIMVVADHGDEFFEHNSIGHRSTLFAEQVRIPMVLRSPNITAAGSRIKNVSRIYDVAPTLLDLATNKSLPGAEGESLSTDIDGGTTYRSAFQNIFSGATRRSRSLNIADGWRDSRFTVLRSFKYNQADSNDELTAVTPLPRRSTNSPYFVFDRTSDPHEASPLAPNDPRYSEALRLYASAFDKHQQYLARVKHSATADCLIDSLSAEEDAVLGSLGYATTTTEDTNEFDIMAIRLAGFPKISY
ncbi:MAG: sulfatase [Planctomycetota bacterium]|nr:sulfatase [Planctomycetota bacterium]